MSDKKIVNPEEQIVREEEEMQEVQQQDQEKELFQSLVQEQLGAHAALLKIRSSLSKTAKDRRTASWRKKISGNVCAIRGEFDARHDLLKSCADFLISEYTTEGVYDQVVDLCSDICSWLENIGIAEVPMRNALGGKMRQFYMDMVTGYISDYEGTLDGEVDVGFVIDRLDVLYSKFQIHNDCALQSAQNSAIREQLVSENNALAERIRNFFCSVRPAEAPQAEPAIKPAAAAANPLTLEAVVAALTSVQSPKTEFRLPRVELNKFDGDCDKWRDFKERFVALVHSRTNISAIEKMHYLQSSLVGEAYETVKNMSLTQYEEGWAALMRRYQNKKILTYNALRKLFSLSSASERSADIKRLLDAVKTIRFDLMELQFNVEDWNAIFVFIISERLPKPTFEAWEQSCDQKTVVQPLSTLEDFLENRIHTLQAIEKTYGKVKVQAAVAQVPSTGKKKESNSTSSENPVLVCKFCSGNHRNFKCPKLIDSSVVERKKLVETHNLCVLCLNDHSLQSCKFAWRCRKCNEKHSTLLHVDVTASQICNSDGNVFLASAQVNIESASGQQRTIRVLIDQGSMRNFVTESVAQALHLPRRPSNTVVVGIGGAEVESNGLVDFSFNSIVQSDLQFKITADILPVVAKNLNELNSELPLDLQNLVLADRFYWKGGRIDAIFGAAVYSDILLRGMIKSTMLAQETHLGWILSGRSRGQSSSRVRSCVAMTDNLDNLLQRFWETEEKIVSVPAWTEEQQEAESFYAETTTRDEGSGRFICKLPLKSDFSLGQSRGAALAYLFKLEQRFERDGNLKDRYIESINEYINLGHAEVTSSPPPPRHCYLPHLAVIKEESLTTKTRVVFNASSPTSNKKSLNDNLLVGPVVQRDLEKKLLRFRVFEHVFICDIEKMYRQIVMHGDDQDLQRFVWRQDPSHPIQDYRLTTVTFGQASAPFTATRTLVQLAKESRPIYPLAADILLGESYVDDLHFGANNVATLLDGLRQLEATLHSAGFSARKYASNRIDLSESVSKLKISPQSLNKFLGIVWDSDHDLLKYPAVLFKKRSPLTKRELLSQICTIFDPLGWVQPLIVPAKMLMQSLWKLNLQWNCVIPDELVNSWWTIIDSLNQIPQLTMPRWIGLHSGGPADLHGFCDASEKAYGAVVYIRSSTGVHLLVSKSRVAPLTPPTIPRLELMGAVLLSDLIETVINALDYPQMRFTCWCDSRVALHWIKGEPAKWKPFVRNRVVYIRQRAPVDRWNYVRTADNPADLISRGSEFAVINDSTFWFAGPQWLSDWTEIPNSSEAESSEDMDLITAEELKSSIALSFVSQSVDRAVVSSLLERHSSFYKIIRVIAWIYRFYGNSKGLVVNRSDTLSTAETTFAQLILVKELQQRQFPEDLHRLREAKLVQRGSVIHNLSPFIDEEGVLRVGGRLSRSLLPFEEKHPLILKFHPILASVLEYHHLAVCHGGPVLTLGNLRRKIWLINGTQHVKKFVRSCLVCHRFRPRLMQQMMAALPPPRISLTKAFYDCGVDFAGPVTLKAEVGRGSRNYKSYVAVFVCLATKAVHLEAVGSLSSDSFMAALKRFVGRRGPVAHMFSDNGTNNVGVFRRLEAVQDRIRESNLKWSFIPPGAPHFGGLWEAGVKSMKTHLHKTLRSTTCTFEELSTVLVQIEAVLNARPLCPFSGDMEDINALTPMHFLTGHQYVKLPDDSEDEGLQLNHRFDYLQSLFINVCKRYKEEYVTRLQQRPKWLGKTPSIRVGQLVLVSEDNLVSTTWPLGRVIQVHPGSDELTRVVTLYTRDGLKKRPVTKLSPLPLDNPKDILTTDQIKALQEKYI